MELKDEILKMMTVRDGARVGKTDRKIPQKKKRKLEDERRDRMLKEHRMRVDKMGARLDNSVPNTFRMKHLKDRAKKKQDRKSKLKRIEHENKMLVQRMTHVMQRPNQFLKMKDEIPKLRGRHDRLRQRELRRIEMENKKLVERLERASPFCTAKKMAQDWKNTKKKMATMCEYPLTITNERSRVYDEEDGDYSSSRKLVPFVDLKLPDMRLFPSRMMSNSPREACSPEIPANFDELPFQALHGFDNDDTAMTTSLNRTAMRGLMESEHNDSMWETPVPPKVEVRSRPSPHHRVNKIPVLSRVRELPKVEVVHGEYVSVSFEKVSVVMLLEEVSRMMEVKVKKLANELPAKANIKGVPGTNNPNIVEKEARIHQLVLNLGDVFNLVNGDMENTYFRLSELLWFRNDQLMLTSKLPDTILEMIPREEQVSRHLLGSSNSSESLDLITNDEEAGEVLSEERAATKLQATYRGHVVRQDSFEKKKAAIMLQKNIRGRMDREKQKQHKKEHESAKVLQKNFRRYSHTQRKQDANSTTKALVPSEERSAAVMLQKNFRGHQLRKHIKGTPMERMVVVGTDYVRLVVKNHVNGARVLEIFIHGEEKHAQRIVFSFKGHRWYRDPTSLMDKLCDELLHVREGDVPTIGRFYLKYGQKTTSSMPMKKTLFRCGGAKLNKKNGCVEERCLIQGWPCSDFTVLCVYSPLLQSSTWFEIKTQQDMDQFQASHRMNKIAFRKTMKRIRKREEKEEELQQQ